MAVKLVQTGHNRPALHGKALPLATFTMIDHQASVYMFEVGMM